MSAEDTISRYELYPESMTDSRYNHLSYEQQFVQRFISPYSFDDELLLFWGMGTGKTCAAAAVSEYSLEVKIFKRAVILAPNENLLNNFARQIVSQCATPGKYESTFRSNTSDIKSELKRSGYQFWTYGTFASHIHRTSFGKYEDTIFILDEVHNIGSTSKESTNIRNVLLGLFKELQNRKILLLTGTPMRNDFHEFSSIVQLLNPHTPSSKFSALKDDRIVDFVDTIRPLIYGKVSFVESVRNPRVNVRMQSNKTIENLSVFELKMHPFQEQYYKEAYKIDVEDKTSFYFNSTHASLFVYPDGTYGSDGFKANMLIKKNGSARFISSVESKFSGSPESVIQKVYPYSVKYAKILNDILDARQNKHCIAVYNREISGSGLYVLEALVNALGFSRAQGNETYPRERYMILTSTLNDNVLEKLIKRSRRTDNVQGDIIRVILFSSAISEGFSFSHIQRMVSTSPEWNMSTLLQAEARGNRRMSHKQLLDFLGPQSTIDYVVTRYVNSDIEKYMYEVSGKKQKEIDIVQKILRQDSVFCPFSSEEDETQCTFKKSDQLDKSFYLKFWAKQRFSDLTDVIEKTVLETKGCCHYSTISEIASWNAEEVNALAKFVNLKQRPLTVFTIPTFVVSNGSWWYLSQYPYTFNQSLPPYSGFQVFEEAQGRRVQESAEWYLSLYNQAFAELSNRKDPHLTLKAFSYLDKADQTKISNTAKNYVDNNPNLPQNSVYRKFFTNNEKKEEVKEPDDDIVKRARALGGYLGLMKGDRFTIMDVRSEKRVKGKGHVRSRGKYCMSWGKGELVEILKRIDNSKDTSSMSKEIICQVIRETMQELKIML